MAQPAEQLSALAAEGWRLCAAGGAALLARGTGDLIDLGAARRQLLDGDLAAFGAPWLGAALAAQPSVLSADCAAVVQVAAAVDVSTPRLSFAAAGASGRGRGRGGGGSGRGGGRGGGRGAPRLLMLTLTDGTATAVAIECVRNCQLCTLSRLPAAAADILM